MPSFSFGPLTLERLTVGPIQENAYLLYDTARTAVLIDPGDEPDLLLGRVQALNLTVRAIVLTHAHFDHIGAVQPLRLALKVPVLLHPADLEIYRNGKASAARFGLAFEQPEDPDRTLEAGQTLNYGEITLEVRHLPGHAPGHVVLVGAGFVLAGDTLFRGSIGRTDLPGGDLPTLLSGIRRELLTLPPNTVVYPGHGPETTVEAERSSNPFLR